MANTLCESVDIFECFICNILEGFSAQSSTFTFMLTHQRLWTSYRCVGNYQTVYLALQTFKRYFLSQQVKLKKVENMRPLINAIVPLNVKATSLNSSTRLLNQPQSTNVINRRFSRRCRVTALFSLIMNWKLLLLCKLLPCSGEL